MGPPYHSRRNGASFGANAHRRGSDLDIAAGKVHARGEQYRRPDTEITVRACVLSTRDLVSAFQTSVSPLTVDATAGAAVAKRALKEKPDEVL